MDIVVAAMFHEFEFQKPSHVTSYRTVQEDCKSKLALPWSFPIILIKNYPYYELTWITVTIIMFTVDYCLLFLLQADDC